MSTPAELFAHFLAKFEIFAFLGRFFPRKSAIFHISSKRVDSPISPERKFENWISTWTRICSTELGGDGDDDEVVDSGQSPGKLSGRPLR